MRANRYVAAIVGAALAVSFALPGAVSAQEQDWQGAFNLYKQKNYSAAESAFREICAHYEDNNQPWGWCHLMLGTVLAEEGRANKRQEALAQLEIAKELVTSDGELYMTYNSIASIHLLDRRWGQAIAAADEAQKFASAEQRAGLAKTRGQAYYQNQDFQDAIRELEIAIQSYPSEAKLHSFLGRSYFESGDPDKALPALNQASRLDRTDRIGLYFAARIQLSRGEYAQAVALAERAIQAYPQDTAIRSTLGAAYLGAQRYEDAIQQFEVVIEDSPNEATALLQLGEAHGQLENWPAAIEQYQKAQNLLPAGGTMQARLLFNLGVAFEMIDRFEDALGAYRDSVAISDSVDKQDAIAGVEEKIRRAKAKGGGQ